VPALALLGNGAYTVMVTSAGAGASGHGAMLVNRWRNDATRDAHGQWCYVKNVATGDTWSAGHNPVAAPFASYEVELSGTRARIRRRDGAIETLTEIVVLPDGTGEARRISITNHSKKSVNLELTSYQEVVLATAVSDRGHRAFGNLFVQTEWLAVSNTIIAMRRPRSAADKPSWCGHSIAIAAGTVVSCETDRARFIGRGRSSRNPIAMDNHGQLSGSAGAVLDPILALRAELAVGAGETVSCVFSTFVAEDRDGTLASASRCSDIAQMQEAIGSALGLGDIAARELGIDDSSASELQTLASELIYGTGRIPTGTRDDLRRLGPSGDYPIFLARLDGASGPDAVKKLLGMQAYWARKGIVCDLVALCGDPAVAKDVTDATNELHGVFVVDESAAGPGAVELLDSVARLRVGSP
jgi:cyclic beta-1,2-glucan synthetase